MNRRLRGRHRWMTTSLAVAVPLVFIAAMATRPQLPDMDRLPVAQDAPSTAFNRLVADRAGVTIDDATVTLSLLASDTSPVRYAVKFRPDRGQAVNGADVLVYWTDASDGGSSPPGGAFLLGTLAGPQTRVFELPAAARPGLGRLVFYSLAQQRLVEPAWALPGDAS